MSITRLAASYVDPGTGVPLRRAILYVLLLGSNLATFLLSSRYSSCATPPAAAAAPPKMSTPNPKTTTVLEQPADLPLEFHAFAGPHALPYGRNANWGTAELRPPVGHPSPVPNTNTWPSRTCSPPSCRTPSTAPAPTTSSPRSGSSSGAASPCRAAGPGAAAAVPGRALVHAARPLRPLVRLHVQVLPLPRRPRFDDCKDCFDLVGGPERHRWLNATDEKRRNPLNFSIDEVLASAYPPGSVCIGLDIGGGSGTFAVRMRERGVTVNLNGPFSSFVAARGIVPLYVSIAARLPFFDNTLDIVHSMHVLSGWIPPAVLQFVLFDVYRVLRPGGLFWLDHFFCGEAEMAAYVDVVESVGFGKLRWVTGRKLDRGPEKKEMYLSALLEKPLKNSWRH